jgi:hypothetical protein
MDEVAVTNLQMRIDETADLMRSSATMLENIKLKLKTLHEVINDPNVIKAKTPQKGMADDEVDLEEDEEGNETPEQKQNKDRCIRAFNLNPKVGMDLVKELLGDSSAQVNAFLTGSKLPIEYSVEKRKKEKNSIIQSLIFL